MWQIYDVYKWVNPADADDLWPLLVTWINFDLSMDE